MSTLETIPAARQGQIPQNIRLCDLADRPTLDAVLDEIAELHIADCLQHGARAAMRRPRELHAQPLAESLGICADLDSDE